MQQRQLRLGDILDDYCPRERRLANHTIVAMVGDNIRLTRCTTCDTEHPYKGAKAPRLRKKKTAYDEVLESVKQDAQTPGTRVIESEPEAPETARPDGAAQDAGAAEAGADEEGDNGGPATPEEARLHRPLIRAQLPRVERESAARPAPEFTIRQAGRRPGRFQNSRPARFAKGGGPSNRSGDPRGQGGPHHGVRQGGRPQGNGSQARTGGARHRGQHPGGKKRSR